MGVACSSRRVRVSHVLSSSPPCCEDVSSSPEVEDEEDELEADDESCERSVKAAAVLISEQVEETLELMLEGTSFSCEDATVAKGWSTAAGTVVSPSFCKESQRDVR